MVSDSISDPYLFSGSSNSRDFFKKKRERFLKANWYTKLKQWKLDARRRRWVSHLVAKRKGGHVGEEDNHDRLKSVADNRIQRKMNFPFASLKFGRKEEEIGDTFTHNESDLESSAASSPTSVLTSKDSSSKSGDTFCCSGQIEEEEEEVFDDAFDNWEGFADALSFFEMEDCSSDSSENELVAWNSEQESSRQPANETQRDRSADKSLCRGKSALQETANAKQGSSETCMKMTQQNSPPEPGPCPICFEDMDATDLSFLPCPCGFRLCLFCHKTIVDGDGRCPCCRKVYETGNSSGEVSFQQRGGGTLRLSPSFRGLDRA